MAGVLHVLPMAAVGRRAIRSIALTVFWVAMIPISYAMGWLDSVVYVPALSLWALVVRTLGGRDVDDRPTPRP